MLSIAVIFLIFASSHCTELCKDKDYWFDFDTAKCQPCKTCGEKSFVMEPCSEFMNTLCVDLREIGRSIDRNIMKGIEKRQHDDKHPKWHETEAVEDQDRSSDVPVANAAVVTSVFENFENEWGHIVMIVVGLSLLFISGSIIILILRISGRRHSGEF